ncbi:MAG TPA: anti-sigma factor [Kofleriaceae bacterium]|nr:anti-sigma factor [Kofleriaceae bacterium]
MSGRNRIEELAALAAAGAATPTERAELDSLLAADGPARALAREYADAAALMAVAVEQPAAPPAVIDAVRARITGRAGRVSAAPPPLDDIVSAPVEADAPGEGGGAGEGAAPEAGAPVIPIERGRRRGRGLALVALPLAAAAAAMALLWWQERAERQELASAVAQLEEERDQARADERLAARGLVEAQRTIDQLQAVVQTVATPELRLATVKQAEGGLMKILVAPDHRRWFVLAFELPPAPAGKDYQLWFMPDKGDPVPAGLLHAGPGKTQHTLTELPPDLTEIKGAAISLEPKGGSDRPTEVVMAGPLI